jgi:hypothetical protein
LVSFGQRLSFLVVLAISFHRVALGQTIGLSVGSANAAPGRSTSLNLSMTASAGAGPTGLEWTIGYSPADVSSVTVTAAAAATGAGKTVACSTGTGSLTCLLYGVNSATISNGVVAQLAVRLSPSTTSTSTAIRITRTAAAGGAGSAIPTNGSGGLVTILQPATSLTALTCSQTSFAGLGKVFCTASLNAAAPAGGFSVGLTSSNLQVVVPASVPIPAGSATGSFTATVSSVTALRTAMITAAASGTTKSAAIALSPAQVSFLNCSPATVPSGNSTSCTVTLAGAAPEGGATVSLSSSNAAVTVPPSVVVTSGATTASFAAAAAGTLAEEVWVTASLDGSSAATMVTASALQIQGSPSELSGWSNGAIITPIVAPNGFVGQLVVAGNGVVNFAPVGKGTGVSFPQCCSNINTAHYKFTGLELGNIFSVNRGQISFYLKSSYSFAQRYATAASARFAFDVQDNVATQHHLFSFFTGAYLNSKSKYLAFGYWLWGAVHYYYVPPGTEDTLFGDGVTMQVTIAWEGNTIKLYLNSALVQTESYSKPSATWTASSVFDLGATEYLTFGGYSSSDDLISEFTVGVPGQP